MQKREIELGNDGLSDFLLLWDSPWGENYTCEENKREQCIRGEEQSSVWVCVGFQNESLTTDEEHSEKRVMELSLGSTYIFSFRVRGWRTNG